MAATADQFVRLTQNQELGETVGWGRGLFELACPHCRKPIRLVATIQTRQRFICPECGRTISGILWSSPYVSLSDSPCLDPVWRSR
jgi:hypothetical protein